ncbi:MAG: hypothetical protein EHM47_13920 [Ignavibacteriales bacterium]|nr:MAG: hypothetical protein EHM47_13920 [Ignavibacteriales bacterium]
MATLKKTILGRISGSVGDIVFRNKNGKNFISSKPASFKTPSDISALERRARFRLTAKFAKAVADITVLKELWRANKHSGMTVNNFIISQSYNHITHEDIGNSASLVPGQGIILTNPSVEVSSELLRLNIDALGNNAGIDPVNETLLRMGGVIFLSSPADNLISKYSFISLISDSLAMDLDNPLSVTINLTTQQAALVNKYQVIKAYCALLTFSAEDKIVNYSQTIFGTG